MRWSFSWLTADSIYPPTAVSSQTLQSVCLLIWFPCLAFWTETPIRATANFMTCEFNRPAHALPFPGTKKHQIITDRQKTSSKQPISHHKPGYTGYSSATEKRHLQCIQVYICIHPKADPEVSLTPPELSISCVSGNTPSPSWSKRGGDRKLWSTKKVTMLCCTPHNLLFLISTKSVVLGLHYHGRFAFINK